jgi:DNA-binding NtrC family response regulator
MDFPITKKQYSLRQHPYYKLLGLAVAFVDADTQNRSFYQQKLEQANLVVYPYADFSELIEDMDKEIHAVIFSPKLDKLNHDIVILGRFIEDNPHLPVITIAQTMHELQLDAIMKLGTRLHINRDLSHPRDLLIALEQVI